MCGRLQEDAAAAKRSKGNSAADQDRRGAAARSGGRSVSQAPPAVHWWQDPQAAFGAAVPAEAATAAARHREAGGVSGSAGRHARPASQRQPASKQSRCAPLVRLLRSLAWHLFLQGGPGFGATSLQVHLK